MNKKPWESKTVWMSLIAAAIPFIPGGQEYVSAHPMIVMEALGVVFGLLRMISKGSISID